MKSVISKAVVAAVVAATFTIGAHASTARSLALDTGKMGKMDHKMDKKMDKKMKKGKMAKDTTKKM